MELSQSIILVSCFSILKISLDGYKQPQISNIRGVNEVDTERISLFPCPRKISWNICGYYSRIFYGYFSKLDIILLREILYTFSCSKLMLCDKYFKHVIYESIVSLFSYKMVFFLSSSFFFVW